METDLICHGCVFNNAISDGLVSCRVATAYNNFRPHIWLKMGDRCSCKTTRSDLAQPGGEERMHDLLFRQSKACPEFIWALEKTRPTSL